MLIDIIGSTGKQCGGCGEEGEEDVISRKQGEDGDFDCFVFFITRCIS